MAAIFFSYAPEDAARAEAVGAALSEAGLDVAWDRSLLPGQRYDSVTARRLSEAKAVVVLWSHASIASNLIMDEAATARDQGKLLPARIDAVDSPMGFRQLQVADLAGWPDASARDGLARLAAALSHMADQPIAAPDRLSPSSPAWNAQPTSSVQRRRFVRTGHFWLMSLFLAAFGGLLIFITPESKLAMGEDSATRTGYMIGNVLGVLLMVAFFRALLHLSRRMIGRQTEAYFSTEFLKVLAGSCVLGGLIAVAPQSDGTHYSLTYNLSMGLIAGLGIIVMGIFLWRGVSRVLGLKPRAA